ncbi:MAG: Cof-type HAD-IIB family hydrolase [Clostridium sp.]
MISFDLDMTLLDHKTGEIPASALDTIRALRKNHKIVLATGRDMDNYYSTIYRDMLDPDAIVHMNGAKITVGGHLIYEHVFDRELLHRLLTFCEKEGFGVGVTEGDEDYYIHPEVIRARDIELWGSCGRRFREPWEMMNQKIRTLAFIGNEEQVRYVEEEFPELRMPLFAGRMGADVMEVGISKADGLRRLAGYFGEKEDLSDTVAFGDSMNDLEVIREAGIGVAMGNAVMELKEAADYVTAPIDEDGIYRACVHLRLI